MARFYHTHSDLHYASPRHRLRILRARAACWLAEHELAKACLIAVPLGLTLWAWLIVLLLGGR